MANDDNFKLVMFNLAFPVHVKTYVLPDLVSGKWF